VRYFSSSSFEENLLRYEKDIKLAGIIYLHRITDNRMGGTPHRNLHMFEELCGDQAVKNVVLVTTMWDRGKTDPKIFNQREKELFNYYWKTMINYGASTARFDNSAASVWNIIDPILKQHETEVLLLQEELVDLKRALNETQAGRALYSELQRLLAERRDTIRSLVEQAREEGNLQLAQGLEAELKRVQKDFDKTYNEIKRLKIPFGKRLLLLLSKKPRGVRILIGIILFSFRTHYLFEQRSLCF
jgi:exonuclease VII small subunit